jgi:hypothetical protein
MYHKFNILTSFLMYFCNVINLDKFLEELKLKKKIALFCHKNVKHLADILKECESNPD